MAVLKIRKQDGTWAIVGDQSAIKYTEQKLTDEQKRIARENIGATSVLSEGTYLGTFNVDTKLDKITTTASYDRLYGVLANGNKWNPYVTASANPYHIVIRNSSGYFSMKDPVNNDHGATKKYVDTNFVAKDTNGNVSITGNLTAEGNTILSSLAITGDLTVQGQTFTQDSETLRIADNIIEINSNKQDNSTVLSGLAINKNKSNTYGLMYDPADDTVKFGIGTTSYGEFLFNNNEGQALAVRDDSSKITDGALMIFDKKTNSLVDSGFTIETLQDWMRNYIEAYMSTMVETTVNETGETLIINTDEQNIRIIDNDEGGSTLIIG